VSETNHHPTLPVASKVLLHVGMPKSGTTAIQHAAASRRPTLLDHGVRYPGTAHNHSKASYAVGRRGRGWGNAGGETSMASWEHLVRETREETERRVLVSHEFFAECEPEIVEQIVQDLGGDVHVVFTMRNQPSILSSTWQQFLKTGMVKSFEQWLSDVIGDRPNPRTTPSFLRRIALADNVARWSSVVGTQNVTVVVLDPRDPALLTEAFEGMLDLPAGFLAQTPLDGSRTNRSMTFGAAELVRSVNATLRRTEDLSWLTYKKVCKQGAIPRLLQNHDPGPDEPRIVTPAWAAARMVHQAREHAARIEASGVRVIGDLSELSRAIPAVEDAVATPTTVPIEVASEFALGAISAGLGRGATFGPTTDAARTTSLAPLEGATVGEQARAVAAATAPISTTALALAVLVQARRRLRRRARRVAAPLRRAVGAARRRSP